VKPTLKPTSKPESNSACPAPKGTAALETADNVGASFKDSGLTRTYSVNSFVTENPVGGVPGLIKYCVYPSTGPKSVKAIYPGWIAGQGKKGSTDFSFSRPGGNSTNIPFDGKEYEVGSATWTGELPKAQKIVLHISDPTACAALYPAGELEAPPGTCFVLPGEGLGPRCGAGDETVAFNNYPFDIIQACPARTSFAFEGNVGTEEYGNGVVLDAAVGAQIKKLTVPFYSFACGVSGHWYSGDCVTNPGQTFSIPASPGDPSDPGQVGGVVARLYEVESGNEVGPLLGAARYTGTFPYRPSANNAKCTGANAGKWFNEEMEPPTCRNSYGKLIPFDFSGQTAAKVPADKQVIWTVSFNTSNSGYFPLGNNTACRESGNPGCGYDSLNVGADSTYVGAPYVGSDMETSTLYYKRTTPPSAWPSPQSSPEDPGEAPLAQIETE
jgi:hypothetical protein